MTKKELISKFFLTIIWSILILLIANPIVMYFSYSYVFQCNFKSPQGIGCMVTNCFAWAGLILVPIVVALNIFKKK